MKAGKPELSTIFLKWREKFLIYGSYCANLTYAQALLQELCDRDELFNQEVFVGVLQCVINLKEALFIYFLL